MHVRTLVTIYATLAAAPALSQQIFDVWTTTWDRTQLLNYENLSPNPVNFVAASGTDDGDITIDDGTVHQSMAGFGASLTDSSALLLSKLKDKNAGNYWSLLGKLFDPTNGANAAGFTYLRVPLGASDFSANVYSFDDVDGDTHLNNFDIGKAPSYLFSTIRDIQGINPYLRVHILPWSPPAWMKDSGTMKGGSLVSGYTTVYANYLLKCLQGFQNRGIFAWAIGIQNEPQHSDPTYPSTSMSAYQEAQIGAALRSLMDANGFASVRLIGYEHNWDDAGDYPIKITEDAGNAFSGVAFHCYEGDVAQQSAFVNSFPDKEVYMTECTGVDGTDWWEDIKWYMDNLFIGSVNRGSSGALMWNLALDGNGSPKLPGAGSCSTACRAVVTVNSDGSYAFNQEYYSMAQASKAVLPRDTNGPFGQRIGSSVGGGLSSDLQVTAYVTERGNSSDWRRYSLVVLNSKDQKSGSYSPSSVKATIGFRGKLATYTFPVGVTTLWWYAQ
ncbi:Endo-1,6-beta-D-glucanase [Trametes pubescens]|uniref:Endo-1,6-beta-D-glucanase n=1 Tax=Trametes pubescens TaxID=154538 RepID=A0A1M2W5T6_TRAPU|nr:Endo-1,6-beta-D-glucanase [Trametes pubescens]